MTRRLLPIALCLTAVAAVALGALNADPRDAELSFPKPDDSTMLWPLDHSWR